ncbi:hypothetical protein J4447_00175 [Candidatus Pacearchaeota archaeon]|nr:hypothetical protein [Candidatus Pacearchaeota archaeon]
MPLTLIEIMALIVALLVVVKIIFVIFSPISWLSFSRKFYSAPKLISLLSLVLAAVVLYFLLFEVSITQIFAVMAFLALLIMSGAAFFAKEVIKIKESLLTKEYARKYWWYILIWLLLAVWALEEILTK